VTKKRRKAAKKILPLQSYASLAGNDQAMIKLEQL